MAGLLHRRRPLRKAAQKPVAANRPTTRPARALRVIAVDTPAPFPRDCQVVHSHSPQPRCESMVVRSTGRDCCRLRRTSTNQFCEPCRYARSPRRLGYASLLAAVRRSRRCRRRTGRRLEASRSRADGPHRLLGSALVAADGLPSHPRRPPAAPAHAELGNAALPDRLGPLAASPSRSDRLAVRGRTGARSVGGQKRVGRAPHPDRRPAGSAGRWRRTTAVSLAAAPPLSGRRGGDCRRSGRGASRLRRRLAGGAHSSDRGRHPGVRRRARRRSERPHAARWPMSTRC